MVIHGRSGGACDLCTMYVPFQPSLQSAAASTTPFSFRDLVQKRVSESTVGVNHVTGVRGHLACLSAFCRRCLQLQCLEIFAYHCPFFTSSPSVAWWWWCRPHPVREHAQDLSVAFSVLSSVTLSFMLQMLSMTQCIFPQCNCFQA